MRICPKCRHQGSETRCPQDGMPMVDPDVWDADDTDRDDVLVGGTIDGKYQVEDLIGRGGMGSVWRARHVLMGHHVALKVIRSDVKGGLTAVQRFYNEARACSRLSHPNTMRVLDFGATDDGNLFMACELLRGMSLDDRLAIDKRLAPLRAVRIALQVCQSLDEAHSLGIVHRDLKPGNIFLAEVHRKEDFVKVIDFGISKVITGPDAQNLTGTGTMIGTPRYMAPEQVTAAAVDGRTDLYALGIILFESITGESPFQAQTAQQMLMAQLAETPRRLPESIDDREIPLVLRDLVSNLLAKRLEDRPAHAVEVEGRLLRSEEQLAAAAKLEGPSEGGGKRPAGAPRGVGSAGTNDGATQPGGKVVMAPSGRDSAETGVRSAPVPGSLAETAAAAIPLGARSLRSRSRRRRVAAAGVALLAVAGVVVLLVVPWPSSEGARPADDRPRTALESPTAQRTAAETGAPAAGRAAAAPNLAAAVPADGAAVVSVAAATAPDGGASGADGADGADAGAAAAAGGGVDAAAPEKSAATAGRPILLDSRPTGATVRVGDEDLGRTPLVVYVAEGTPRVVQLTLDGHRDRNVLLRAGDESERVVELEAPRRPSRGQPDRTKTPKSPSAAPRETRPVPVIRIQ